MTHWRLVESKRVEFRVRNLDRGVHHLLKIKAAIEKKTVNQVMHDALLAYVKPPIRTRPK